MIKNFKSFQVNEFFIDPVKREKPIKIKLSTQYTLMIHSDRQFEGKGCFELFLKEKCVAIGEYEKSMRPIVSDKPKYKKVQIMGNRFSVEPLEGKEKQINLFNINSYKIGCGSILMDGIIKCAKQTGNKTIWLDVLKTNDRAIYLYKKFGFQIDDQYAKLATQVSWYRMYLNL